MKIVIQGQPGCFHEEAVRVYFQGSEVEAIPANNFEELANIINENNGIDLGIMAIENSIAGSILQNYRILRQNQFWIRGEIYHRIIHNLMVYPGQRIEDIYEVRSHPMAINQCLKFFREYSHIKLVESEDTAMSAKEIAQENLQGVGAIASQTAADIYNLEILHTGIETSKVNYTRFFIIGKDQIEPVSDANKASIYCSVNDKSGSLLKVLQVFDRYNMNMSKLQSYPIENKVSEYFFHIDLEIESIDQFNSMREEVMPHVVEFETMGLYKKASIYDYQAV